MGRLGCFLWLACFALAAGVMLSTGGAMAGEVHAEPLESLGAKIPRVIQGWEAEGEDRLFDAQTIFDYIDGAGEVYRAYRMQRCLSRSYASSQGGRIILDLFEMGSSSDAYGVFTHDRDGEPLEMGHEGLYKAGWLRFWKDRFFVSIFDEAQTLESTEAAQKLGKATADLIRNAGKKPEMISLLPSTGLRQRSIRYLHDHVVLNSHYYVSDENILSLGSDTEALLAEYQRAGQKALFLLVSYPSPEWARKAYLSFQKHYLPESGKDGAARLEDGKWAAVSLEGKLLGIVLEAQGRALAVTLLQEGMGYAAQKGR